MEYFTFKRALQIHTSLEPSLRASVARTLSVARQRSDAAETLWANGHAAEALRLAISALQMSSEASLDYARGTSTPRVEAPQPRASSLEDEPALEPADSSDSEFVPEDPSAIRARGLRVCGVSDRQIATINAGLSSAHTFTVPLLDTDVSPNDAGLFRTFIDAHRLIDRALSPGLLERREIQFTRAFRFGAVVFVSTAVALGSYFMTRTPDGVFIEASAVWADAPAFAADKVTDGRADTHWLLPDNSTGWVQARISPGRRVEHVTVLNSHNPPHGDRATNAYRIELSAGGRVVRTIEGAFEYSVEPEPVTYDVGLDGIEQIRFVVRSHHRTSAGLAELSWD